jgi:hypothetical protein
LPSFGPTLWLLDHYVLGFEVSWGGAALGAAESGVGGRRFSFGWALARVINFLVGLVAESVLGECQMRGVLDPYGSPGKLAIDE